jgi:hypothetical protein
MTSTYLSYQVLARDLPRTLKQTASQTQVARDAQYFEANIGKVKTVDEFLKNQRLYAYAMTAYGLADKIDAKAFMRKVLESDLSDTHSFAKQLVDSRFVTFARAFNFTTDGKVATNAKVVQTSIQDDDTVGLYTEHRVRSGEAAAANVQNYQDRIGAIRTVGDFLRDDRLFSLALTAYGLDPDIASQTTIRNVLTSDLSDPQSVANKLGGSYVDLAKAFQFNADGSLPAGTQAQSAAKASDTIYQYYVRSGNGATPAAAAFNTNLYEAAIAAVTSVDDLLGDSKLYSYALTAFGVDPATVSPSMIRQALTSDLSDPSSFANTQPDPHLRDLAAAFNFNADGTVATGEGAQSSDQLRHTSDLYLTHYGESAAKTEEAETAYFQSHVASATGATTVKKVDDLLNDTRLYDYLLKSYDLDPDIVSKDTIKRVLTSDATDPKSFANTSNDARYRKMASDFNFAVDGTVTTPLKAQADDDELATVSLYNSRLGSNLTQAQKDAAKADNTYYDQAIRKVQSLDDFLADKRLVTFVLKAYDLDGEKLSDSELKDKLKKVLTSDPMDKKSYVSKLGDTRYRDLAASYNFTADGKIKRVPAQRAQSPDNLLKTADLFLFQKLETDAGAQSEGVRLALYFRRKAANINTAFDILADKALLQVVKSALSLPDSLSQIDIDAQAKMLTKRLKFADFKDPAKLDKFLAKFGALYDIQNSTSSEASAASVLFGGGTNTGVSDSLLASLQGVRIGQG